MNIIFAGSLGRFPVGGHNIYFLENCGDPSWVYSGRFRDGSDFHLVAGKPVLVQNTGQNRRYDTSYEFNFFSKTKETLEGFQRINQSNEHHFDSTLQTANEAFPSDRVLNELPEVTA